MHKIQFIPENLFERRWSCNKPMIKSGARKIVAVLALLLVMAFVLSILEGNVMILLLATVLSIILLVNHLSSRGSMKQWKYCTISHAFDPTLKVIIIKYAFGIRFLSGFAAVAQPESVVPNSWEFVRQIFLDRRMTIRVILANKLFSPSRATSTVRTRMWFKTAVPPAEPVDIDNGYTWFLIVEFKVPPLASLDGQLNKFCNNILHVRAATRQYLHHHKLVSMSEELLARCVFLP
ncbi:MAG: hypothetical protein ACTSWN_06100 [Promethearchaeota archaeon]